MKVLTATLSSTTAQVKFDYSHEQWIEIENAVAAECSRSLTHFEQQRVRNAALSYKVNSEGMVTFLKSRRKKEDKLWAAVEKLSDQLGDAIQDLSAMYSNPPPPVTKVGPVLERLRSYASARIVVDMASEKPQRTLYRMILELWADLIGGRLTYTTHGITEEISSPCVSFFQAVANPVMKSNAPAVSYIKDLISDEIKRRGMLKDKKSSISRAKSLGGKTT